jgi:hypothetical protein
MSVDISVSITEDIVDIIATPTVNIVNVTNSASIDPGLYDLSEFTNTSGNPFVRASGLSSYVPSTRSILTTSPLVGGGDLSANRTISIPQATSSVNGFLSSTDWTTFNNKQNALGFTPVPETRTLTINGVTQDLSADRTFTIATGLTIGTTPIASGTIGRVLFEGTGNVLQQSSSLFWDNTNGALQTTTTADGIVGFRAKSTTGQLKIRPYVNTAFGLVMESRNAADSAYLPVTIGGSKIQLSDGNVLINTTTDAGFRLDVNGTARVSGNTTITSADVANPDVGPPAFNIFNGTFSKFNVVYNAAGCRVNMLGTSTQGLQINTGSSTSFSTIGGGGLTFSCGTNNFQIISASVLFNVAGSERARFAPSTGNFLINTTTDAGFKLDVNGTARVSSTTTIGTSAHPFASNLLTLISDQGSASFRIGGGSAVICSSSISAVNLSANDFVQCVRVLVGGAARINATTTDWLSVTNWAQSSLGSGNVSANLATFGTAYATINASAQVEIASTTKGFLPPRGSNAQMLAIASPATGLIFFDNTNNKLNCYDGTTWQPCW